MAEPAIEVEELSTSYRVHVSGSSVLGGVRDLYRRGQSDDRIIPALQEVSFTVPRGNVLGIIGRNGAGKSTLLRCLAGILVPEHGRVVMRGRISTLLSIGVGMNPNLTGRENIRLGGLAMGIEPTRLDEITDTVAEFAQLGEYVDLPVQTYSTGMRSRLGFAVVAHLDPEILLIDEALSAGDSKYQAETAHKMAELCGEGRTIVLVSHSLPTIRTMATQAIWMHQGRIVESGDPEEVSSAYMRYCRLSDLDPEHTDGEREPAPLSEGEVGAAGRPDDLGASATVSARAHRGGRRFGLRRRAGASTDAPQG